MDIKFTYKQNNEVIEKEFNDYLDLVEFVALKGIKDEDFVSMNLGDEEISGGINGLALYALRTVDKIREERKAAEEEYEDEEDECEDTDDLDNDLQNTIEDFNDFLDNHTGEDFVNEFSE